jgi:transposase InsO family protein
MIGGWMPRKPRPRSAAGIEVLAGTVAGIMAENGWPAKRMRAFKRTTIPSDPDKVFADLIARDFTAQAPGARLAGDIAGACNPLCGYAQHPKLASICCAKR